MAASPELAWLRSPEAAPETIAALRAAISQMEIEHTKALVAKRDLIWLGYWEDFTDAYLETKILKLEASIAYLSDLVITIQAEVPALVGLPQ